MPLGTLRAPIKGHEKRHKFMPKKPKANKGPRHTPKGPRHTPKKRRKK